MGGCKPSVGPSATSNYDAFRRWRRAVTVRARSAWFTDRESRNIRATSGSNTTTLLPVAKRRAYFPRMPREKSYSFNNSARRPVRLPLRLKNRASRLLT